jgi:hypothetical protein
VRASRQGQAPKPDINSSLLVVSEVSLCSQLIGSSAGRYQLCPRASRMPNKFIINGGAAVLLQFWVQINGDFMMSDTG